MGLTTSRLLLAAAVVLGAAGSGFAQNPPAAPPPPPPVEDVDRGEADLPFVPSEPDFTLIDLPTSLRMPAGRWGFRVSHRFTRALGQGDFGDLVSDFFGFDSGAIVGLEVRYGLWPGAQLSLLRTSDRTIQFLGQVSVLEQREGRPFNLDGIAAIQGFDNFTEDYTTTLGLVASRRLGDRGAVYVEPLIVLEPLPESGTADDTVFVLGMGARLLLASNTYVVGEYAPRLSGDLPGDDHASFAIERRKGGHSFQINFSNSFATTLGQVARSYGSAGEWHIGFNITRKFY